MTKGHIKTLDIPASESFVGPVAHLAYSSSNNGNFLSVCAGADVHILKEDAQRQ